RDARARAATQGRAARDGGAARAILRRRRAGARVHRILQDAPARAHHAHPAIADAARRARRARAIADPGDGARGVELHGTPPHLNRTLLTFSFGHGVLAHFRQ